MRKITYSLLIIIASALFTSCSDFLDVSASNELPDKDVIKNVKEAQAALDGVYKQFQSRYYYGCDFITYGDVRGDDLGTTKSGDRTNSQYTFGHLNSTTSTNGGYFWEMIYSALNRTNSLLGYINNGSVEIKTAADQTKLDNIKAQTYALRAYLHFDLIRVYGEPYLKNKAALGVVKADRVIKKEEKPERATVEEIYSFIIDDLTTAINSKTTVNNKETTALSNAKDNAGRMNLWAAKAFLSKVYLYMGKNKESYTLAKEVIDSGEYSLIPRDKYVSSWGEAFSDESIFEIYNDEKENANRESLGYVISFESKGGYKAVSLTDTLTNFYAELSKDPEDCRLDLLQLRAITETKKGYSYERKYPGRGGDMYVNNPKLIRLSEVYLIAAEAGALAGEADAANYLDAIRQRATTATLAPTTATGEALVELVMMERRKELFGEGHRFFDITRNLGDKVVKRVGTVNNPISAGITIDPNDPSKNKDIYVSEISWNNKNTYLLILPIPNAETDNNKNIVQNPGYPF